MQCGEDCDDPLQPHGCPSTLPTELLSPAQPRLSLPTFFIGNGDREVALTFKDGVGRRVVLGAQKSGHTCLFKTQSVTCVHAHMCTHTGTHTCRDMKLLPTSGCKGSKSRIDVLLSSTCALFQASVSWHVEGVERA